MNKPMSDVSKKCKWMLVAAARPNFMKIAPLIRAIKGYNEANGSSIQPMLVHTGQHYDKNMSDAFFKDLNIPAPDIHLGIGSGTHAEQTGRVMIEFEQVLIEQQPHLVIVVGDVNSTMACTIAAAKLCIPVVHVEAGLRSFDRSMPEEINRIVTDALADYLFTPSSDASENLLKEGIPQGKIFLVGNIMIDTLRFNLERARKLSILSKLGLKSANSFSVKEYALLTLHRPANVDDEQVFGRILSALNDVASKIPILFPVHPRTRKQIEIFGSKDKFVFHSSVDNMSHQFHEQLDGKIHCFDPIGYLEFLNLMANALFVLTDSGGIQEETTALNVPCITIRDSTERPITVTEGTNVLVGDRFEAIVSEVEWILQGRPKQGRCPALWDGRTSERIVSILKQNSKN